jgi:hypothetical protein
MYSLGKCEYVLRPRRKTEPDHPNHPESSASLADARSAGGTFATQSARREAAAVLVREHRMSVQRSCRIARLSRAAYYRPPRPAVERDAAVIAALNTVVERHSGRRGIPGTGSGFIASTALWGSIFRAAQSGVFRRGCANR